MSQPTDANHNTPPEPDPLLAFFAEPDPAPPPTPAEPVANAEVPRAPDSAAARAEADDALRLRVDRAERQLEKSVIEIAALKTEIATLVTVVDDIKKRQSRPPAPPAPPLPSPRAARVSRAATAAAAIAIVLFSLVLWGAYYVAAPDSAPEAAPVETAVLREAPPEPVAAPAPEPPAPIPTAAPADTGIRNVATVPPRVEERRISRRQNPYVGSLTVDASPDGEVLVNRKRVGRTPVRVDNLRAGSHLIWIERQGYRRFTRVVAVTADNVARVSAELEPLTR